MHVGTRKLLAVLLIPGMVGLWARADGPEVRDISGTNYLPAVHAALGSATQSIVVVMYMFRLPPTPVMHPGDTCPASPYTLLQDLVDAHERGVAVHVLLDSSYRRQGRTGSPARNPGNARAHEYLHRSGIMVTRGPPGRYVHDKVAVIDGATVIHGSANWTASAFARNSESSTLCTSRTLAESTLDRLKKLDTDTGTTFGQSFTNKGPVSSRINLPVSLLTNTNLFSAMVSTSDERAFDTYIWLTALATDAGVTTNLTVLYDEAAAQLGIGGFTRYGYRRQISKTLRKLRDRYGLIDCGFRFARPAKVDMSALDNPEQRFIALPRGYLAEGWARRLTLKAKFMYLICLHEKAGSVIRPWWTRQMQELAGLYGVDESLLYAAVRELEREEILEVARDAVPADRSEPRVPNRYLVWPLPLLDLRASAWAELAERHDAGSAALGRELAGMMDRPHDADMAETFIRLAREHGEERVRSVTARISGLHPGNPHRTMRYLVGALEKSPGRRAGDR